jgi:hypothetical protein
MIWSALAAEDCGLKRSEDDKNIVLGVNDER